MVTKSINYVYHAIVHDLRGLQKGTLLGDSLEAKWSSNGGHNDKSNKTLHDAYF